MSWVPAYFLMEISRILLPRSPTSMYAPHSANILGSDHLLQTFKFKPKMGKSSFNTSIPYRLSYYATPLSHLLSFNIHSFRYFRHLTFIYMLFNIDSAFSDTLNIQHSFTCSLHTHLHLYSRCLFTFNVN